MASTITRNPTAPSENDAIPSTIRQNRLARRKLRIGVFTDSYIPVVNGVTTSVLTLIEHLERLGHTVQIFAPRYPGYDETQPNVTRFPSVLTALDPGYPLPLPFSHHLISAVSRYNLDIIHSQSPFMLGLVALMVARAESIPLVATNHTLYTEYSHYVPVVPEEITKGVTRSIVHWYYERCDAVIAPSLMAATRLRDDYLIQKTVVKIIPTGVPIGPVLTESERNEVRLKYGLAPDTPVLIFAGRIAKEKNLQMLLDAFEQIISPARPDVRLVLAGSGPDAEHISQKIKESPILRRAAFLTGFLGRHDLDPLYAASDIFVFPSVTETQGVVLGEALAAGIPVVAINAAGTPETVTDGVDGVLTPNDPALFAEAIIALLDDHPKRISMGHAARKLAENRTPEKMIEHVLGLYRIAQRRVAMRKRALIQASRRPAEFVKRLSQDL